MPLNRTTPLTSRTPLRRTPMKPRARELRRVAVKARERAATARRRTGPSQATRELVIYRAGGCCEVCGLVLFIQLTQVQGPYSIHHRQPRGMGGTRRESINSPANLLLLCGDATDPRGCHHAIESNRAEAYATGRLVRAADDPAQVPVLLEGGDHYLLTDTGERIEVPR